MHKSIALTVILAILLAGCGQIQTNNGNQVSESAKTEDIAIPESKTPTPTPVEETEEPTEEEDPIEEWKIAYANCLNNIMNNVEPICDSLEAFYYDSYKENGVLKNTPFYALLDMTGDDVPELIISAREPGDSWAEYSVYQAEGRSYGPPLTGVFAWDKDEKLIYCGHDMSIELYKADNGRIVFFESYADYDGTWEYEAAGKDPVSVSESDYNAFIDKVNALRGNIGADFVPLTAENVDKEFADIPDISDEPSSFELFDAFLAGRISAEGHFNGMETFYISDLTNMDEEWLNFRFSGYVDADNDGEDELVMDGPYGGMILDKRDGKVFELAGGEGTAGVLDIAKLDNEFWIVHQDTSHGGRQIYVLDKYNGKGEIVESTSLGAEYWDSPDDQYDENSVFYFKDKPISMEEFERIRDGLFMWQNSGFN